MGGWGRRGPAGPNILGPMFILFGYRSRAATLAMLTLACRNGHTAAHRLVKVTRWFTLFFIPVIPFSKRYFSVCAQCGVQVTWTKADAEATVAQVAAQPAGVAPAEPVNAPLPQGGVGSGGTDGPPAGWFPDPAGTGQLRYWDGGAWTDSVHQP
jgi:hypothetical protein